MCVCVFLCVYVHVFRYKEWCTEKNAWAVVVPVIIVVALFNIPKTLDSEVTFFNDCVALNRRYNLFLSCLGGQSLIHLNTITTIYANISLHAHKSQISTASSNEMSIISSLCDYAIIFLGARDH